MHQGINKSEKKLVGKVPVSNLQKSHEVVNLSTKYFFYHSKFSEIRSKIL